MVKRRFATLYKLSDSKLTLEREGVITDVVKGKDSNKEDFISMGGLGNLVSDLKKNDTLIVLITNPDAKSYKEIKQEVFDRLEKKLRFT